MDLRAFAQAWQRYRLHVMATQRVWPHAADVITRTTHVAGALHTDRLDRVRSAATALAAHYTDRQRLTPAGLQAAWQALR